MEAGGGIREEASLLGGEGVRARTSTTFRSFDNDDAVTEEEEDEAFIVTSAPEPGDSDRLVIPIARVAAEVGSGGDGDLERGTDTTTFKVIIDADGAEDDLEVDADADALFDTVESADILMDVEG